MTSTPHTVWEVQALLGEGPLWVPGEAALRFVDIKSGHLHRFEPATGKRETVNINGAPSFIVSKAGAGFLVGSGHSVHGFDGRVLGAAVATVPQPQTNRTNDASVDTQGRLWFGTMDDRELKPTGAIWCLERGVLHRAGGDAVVTNGPAFSSGGTALYRVDSSNRTIWRHRLDGQPRLAGGEVFVQLDEDEGVPDGIVVDSDDCVWVALWGGWGVRRYAFDGQLMQQIDFPCALVTKLAFGGPDLRTAFVTTARVGLDQAEISAQPLAGSLFAFEAPAAGRVLPEVQLS